MIGIVEGKLGSVRIFFVNPTFQRLFVGKRLLQRVMKIMTDAGCVRAMFSLPSCRNSVENWIMHQGFEHISSIKYPASFLSHEILEEKASSIELDLFSKSLTQQILKSNVDIEDSEEPNSTSNLPPQDNLHLPPHWRGIKTSRNDKAQLSIGDTMNAFSAEDCVNNIPDVD